MILDYLVGNLILIVILVDLVTIFTMLYLERSNPKSFLLWTLVFILLPLLGFIMYLLLGQTFYTRHEFRPKEATDDEIQKYVLAEKKGIDDVLKDNPELKEIVSFVHAIRNTGGIGIGDNHDFELYTLGQNKFDRLYEDIRNAKEYIHLEYYIIRDDELGNELLQILTDKVKEGVQVRLLTDAFGNGKGPKKAIKKFVAAGGEFALFHNVVTLILSPKKNNRNHRKIAVIDGEIAYVGGFNIGDEYLGKGPLGYWRDTAVRVIGTGTAILNLRFCLDWNYASENKIDITDIDRLFKRKMFTEEFGHGGMQLVSGGPDVAEENPVQMQYLCMIRQAKKSIYIHTPYLLPNDAILYALKVAAANGVDVRIIIPDKPDHPFVFWNNISAANKLMLAGVRVYMYNRGFVHSKTIVSDGFYVSVGSANLDDRSLKLNFETNAMIYSQEIGKEMNDVFFEDLNYCTEYSCSEYEKRTVGMKLKIAFSSLFRELA